MTNRKLMTFSINSRPNVNTTTERDRLFGLYKLFPVLKYWDFHEKTVYHVNFITSVTLFIHIYRIIYVNHYLNHFFTILPAKKSSNSTLFILRDAASSIINRVEQMDSEFRNFHNHLTPESISGYNEIFARDVREKQKFSQILHRKCDD